MSSFENDPMPNLPPATPPQPGKRRAAWWQITATAIGAIIIVALFLWGITNQRDETAGQQTAGTQPTPVTPQGAGGPPPGQNQQPPAQNQQQAGQQQQGQGNAPTTTGQGSGDQGDAAHNSNAGQKTIQQPTNPGQNGQLVQPRGQ